MSTDYTIPKDEYSKLVAEDAKLKQLASGMYDMLKVFDTLLGCHDACETPRPLVFGETGCLVRWRLTMVEYVVDCEHVPYGDGKVLVLPISINGHIHERLVRCRDCKHCHEVPGQSFGEVRHECRLNVYSRHYTELDGFCHKAVPRGGDG